jgi:hypothetical protein
MKEIFVLCIIAWLTFAFFDFSVNSQIYKVYTATDFKEFHESDSPKLFLNSVLEFRIFDDKVTTQRDGRIDGYNNCIIFDNDNWKCIIGAGLAEFGAKQGKYFESPEHPHKRAVSRFRYILFQCEDDYLSGGLSTFDCLFRPFTT